MNYVVSSILLPKQNKTPKSPSNLLLAYITFCDLYSRNLFSVCCHFIGGVREDIVLVHHLKELRKTASAPKIIKAMAKQARRQHVLTVLERMAPTVARKSTSNTNPEFGQVLVVSLLQGLLNIH